MSIDLLIIRNRAKLEKLITEDKEYSKILKQSQKLDKLINRKMGILKMDIRLLNNFKRSVSNKCVKYDR